RGSRMLCMYARRSRAENLVYRRRRMAWHGKGPGGRGRSNGTSADDRGTSIRSWMAVKRVPRDYERTIDRGGHAKKCLIAPPIRLMTKCAFQGVCARRHQSHRA